MHVSYSVDLRDRHAHLYTIEARFPAGGDFVDVKLPVWTPGSYLVREYPRHLQDISCDDGDGRLLPFEKIDKATWRVDARPARQLRVRYRVYAYELTGPHRAPRRHSRLLERRLHFPVRRRAALIAGPRRGAGARRLARHHGASAAK
jgi:predicted metalloprotease with PDZ domain